MSIKTQIDRLNKAKSDIVNAITGKGVEVASGTYIDGLADLISSIDSIKTGSFTISSAIESYSVTGLSEQPKNVLVFFSENETFETARGVFGWARTDLFSGVVDYIKSAATVRTTWSNFTIGNSNPYLEFTSDGFTVSCVTTTSPLLVGTYNFIVW